MPERKCDCCGQFYAVWFTDNDIWNKYSMGYSFLCPTCFTFLAEGQGCKTTGWFVTVEERAAVGAQPPQATNNESDAIAASLEFEKRYPDSRYRFGSLKCHDYKSVFINGWMAAKAHVS
jgi:hypothetical protein